jgi:hypothetical protein
VVVQPLHHQEAIVSDHDHTDTFDRGLHFDLSTMLRRRRVLGLFAGASLAALVGSA